MDDRVTRIHMRGQLASEDLDVIAPAIRECTDQICCLIGDGRLMTAALYHYGSQLFLYYEAIGKPLQPQDFMTPLHPYLVQWPCKGILSDWAEMYPVFHHDEPRDREDWSRTMPPSARRGRIAYLNHQNMWEYVIHHEAIVKEGILQGDRYQAIAMHEDVLFSYFEEPKQLTNMRRSGETESAALKAWLAADPEAHFIHLPGSGGQSFLLLPALFALGEENADQ